MSQVSTVSSTPCRGRTEVAPRTPGDEAPGASKEPDRAAPAAFTRGRDRVEFSSAARAASVQSVEKEQPIRTSLVQSIRAEIESGQYEDGTKLDIAVERLMKQLGL
jgi:anti-sigma28 factor (negative regulator of flagellin synthesis)